MGLEILKAFEAIVLEYSRLEDFPIDRHVKMQSIVTFVKLGPFSRKITT